VAVEFVDRVVALHDALVEFEIPHAFGGALALAYHAVPRGTVEIDCNVFVPVALAGPVIERLGVLGIEPPPDGIDGVPPVAGLRCPWDETHVDLFTSYDHAFFGSVERRIERHAFEVSNGRLFDLPFLSAEDLCIFKVTFDRQKDWADIEAMLAEAPLDTGYVRQWLVHLRGEPIWPNIRRLEQLSEAAEAGREATGEGRR